MTKGGMAAGLCALARAVEADVSAWERGRDEMVSAPYALAPEEIKTAEGQTK